MVAYVASEAIEVNTITADGTLGTTKIIVPAPASGTTYSSPSIAMQTDGSYILCYSKVVMPVPPSNNTISYYMYFLKKNINKVEFYFLYLLTFLFMDYYEQSKIIWLLS